MSKNEPKPVERLLRVGRLVQDPIQAGTSFVNWDVPEISLKVGHSAQSENEHRIPRSHCKVLLALGGVSDR